MKIRIYCTLLLVISICIAGDVFARSSNDRLNVIVVMTDDQGYPDISCHGNDVIKAPNMDKLSAGRYRSLVH